MCPWEHIGAGLTFPALHKPKCANQPQPFLASLQVCMFGKGPEGRLCLQNFGKIQKIHLTSPVPDADADSLKRRCGWNLDTPTEHPMEQPVSTGLPVPDKGPKQRNRIRSVPQRDLV